MHITFVFLCLTSLSVTIARLLQVALFCSFFMTNTPPLMIFPRLLCRLPLLPAPKWSPSEVQPLALSIPCTLSW